MRFLDRIFGGTKSTVIKSSKELLAEMGLGYQTDSGVSVTPESSLHLSAVMSCVRVMSTAVGMLPCKMHEKRGDSRVEVVDHTAARLMAIAPNDFQTPQEFKEMLVAQLMLCGAFFAFKNRVGGEIRELLPWQHGVVTPKLGPQFDLVYEVRYPDGKADVLTQDEVLHIRMPTLDGFTGLTPIVNTRQPIGAGLAMDKHSARLFKNGARVGGVLSTDSTFKDQAAVDRIRQSWNETYGGSENAHKTAILENGLSYQSIGMTQEDAQFLESKKLNRSEIAGLFGVPPHMIGELDRATFSNIEQQSLDFYKNGVLPFLTRIEERLRTGLIDSKDQAKYFFKFNANALLRGDAKSRGEFYWLLLQAGSLSPNEIRQNEDMNPRDGGDIYLTPMNMAINGKPIVANEENSNAETT